MEIATADGIEGVLEPVIRLVSSANSYDEMIDGLLDCYPNMDTEGFAALIKEALLVSHLKGSSTAGQRNA